MNVHSKIDKIIEEDFNNYRGTYNRRIQYLHNVLRNMVTDEKFLEFLKECRLKNPKPVYKIPDEVLKQMQK